METYGIRLIDYDIEGGLQAHELLWLASLCAQLPYGSRLSRAIDPDAAWTQEQWTLWRIEQELQWLVQSKAKHPKKVKPMTTPAELAKRERMAESIEKNREKLEKAFL